MNEGINFIIDTVKKLDNGTLPDFPDPDEPEDLGEPLTQDDIDFIKKLRKEFQSRYTTL